MRRIAMVLVMAVICSALSAAASNLNGSAEAQGKLVRTNENKPFIQDENNGDRMVPDPSQKDAVISNIQPDTRQIKTAGNSFKDLSLYMSVGMAYLFSGTMYDYLHNGLKPTPLSIESVNIAVGMDWYFFKIIGISLGFEPYMISASFPSGYNSLLIGYGTTAKAMLLVRIPFKPFMDRDDRFMGLALRFFAGPTYNTFDYSDSYKKLVEKAAAEAGYTMTWYGAATGIGVAGGMGVLFEYDHLGCGLDLFVQKKYLSRPEAVISSADWLEFGTSFRVSFDF